jgi:hypothetical protein
MCKKTKISKKTKKRNNKMTYLEFKEMLSGLTDEEISQVYGWLSVQQQKP